MEQKFSLAIIMTVGAFMLAVYLFVFAIIQNNTANVEPPPATAEQTVQQPQIEYAGEKIFNANCKACHRIHQKLVGPALAGVLERRDSLWVIKMIRNSTKLIASGDPIAVSLFNEYNATTMTAFPSFTDEELRSLLEYLRHEGDRGNVPMPSTPRVEV